MKAMKKKKKFVLDRLTKPVVDKVCKEQGLDKRRRTTWDTLYALALWN